MTSAPTYWFCLGIPPKVPPCGESGHNDRDAEKHTQASMHSTTSGLTEAGARAVLCHVTVNTRPGRRYDNEQQPCGEHVERDGLCAFHLSEKERLS